MMLNQEWVVNVWRVAGALAVVLWPVVWFASLSSWKYALGPEVSAVWTRRWRVWLSLASFGVGAWLMVVRLQAMIPQGMEDNPFLLAGHVENATEHPMDLVMSVAQLWCAGLLPVLGAALGVKLFEKWVNGRLSEAERQPGRVGVRAWLSGWNVILVLGIALCAWLGYGYLSFFAVLLMAIALVLAYPLVTTAMSSGVPTTAGGPAGSSSDLSPERERVLRMLEEGKVTAEEAAELLSALGATIPHAAGPAAEPWTPGRKLMVLGAAVVLVGFFLPWFEINLGREMRQAMNQAFGAMPMGAEMQQMVGQGGGDAVSAGGATVRVTGGDIGHGLGWIALGLGVGAALVPVLLPTLAREQRRAVMAVALAGGAVIVLYLLTGNLSRVSFGLPLVLIGYAVEIVGLLRDQFAWQVPALRTAQAV